MNIKSSEVKEKSKVELIVEVSREEYDEATDEAFRKTRNNISIPGFRKGKAPRRIIERMYGDSAFHNDALDIILPKALVLIGEESSLRIIGNPSVSGIDTKKDEGGLDVTFELTVYPEVILGEYKGLSAAKPPVEVLDSEVDGEIEAVRLRNARIEKVERPAKNGDVAFIDFDGYIDGEQFDKGSGENFELHLGSNTLIPGFEEKVLGMTVGEERDLDLVFPDDYTAELAGKPVLFKVKLKELEERIPPDLDDEFAKDVSEFDTFEEYRSDVRKKILEVKQSGADQAFEDALMGKLIEDAKIDVPDVFIDDQLGKVADNYYRQIYAMGMDPLKYLQMTNTTPESFREKMRAESERQVTLALILEKIAEVEDINVSEEDVENEYIKAAELYGKEIDEMKESVSEEELIHDIKLKRAARIVLDSASVETNDAHDAPETSEASDMEAGKE